MSSTYRNRADKRIADDVGQQSDLMCSAHGCPLRWSVDFGARLCSCHAGRDPLQWPAITQRIIDAETEQAMRSQEPAAPVRVRQFTAADKRAIGQRLRKALRMSGGRQWAERLQQREQEGQHLTDAQRAMWRQALGRGAVSVDDFDEVAA